MQIGESLTQRDLSELKGKIERHTLEHQSYGMANISRLHTVHVW